MVRILISICLFMAATTLHSASINAVALKNGCRLAQRPSSFYTSSLYTAKIDDWSAQAVMDQNPATSWCSGATSKAPYVFVFELSEEYTVQELRFINTGQSKYPGISSKDISIEYSSTSAAAGYTSMGNYTLPENSTVSYNASGIKARWIRLTILSNYGNTQWTTLTEFEALGSHSVSSAENTSINGLWNSNYDWVSFKKNAKGYQYGCYKWAHGTFFNGVQKRRVYRFEWKQKDNTESGWCILVVNKEGNRINGVWGRGKDTTQFGFWEMTKTQAEPYVCDADEEVKNFIAGTQQKEAVKEVLIEVVIDVIDLASKKHIPGTIELFAEKNYYTIPSGDGLYMSKISKTPFVVVKTALPNYFPTSDTLELDTLSQKYLNIPVYVTRLAVGSNIVLKNILFNKGSAELLPASMPELEMIYSTMNQYPTMEIELSGHTDNLGDAKKNVVLSEQRVRAVKDYLINKGIGAARIKGFGYGGRYPIASNNGEKTRKLNRRVELKITKM